MVHFGDTGAEVAKWQLALVTEKYLVTDQSGVFGESTHNSTLRYQREHGLKVDGIVGPITWGTVGRMISVTDYDPESFDLDAIPYVEAMHYDRVAKPRTSVALIVIHTMETPETLMRAETSSTRFASLMAPLASYHYAVDADSIVQSVKEEHIAWHAPGVNGISIGIEHAGYARQTAEEWADPYSKSMLRLSARLVARICRRWKIPAVFVNASNLIANLRGITTHAAVSEAYRKSTHWDPGPHFPAEQYCRLVREISL